MKLLLENWREYIKEVEAFDDIATTPEQIQQSIDWFYTSPDFDRGKKKGEESWEGHTIITYGLSKGDEFHFVVNKDGNPVAYVATAPFREGYAVGNVRKSVKKPWASQLYQWLIDRYGVLYSDKAQTTDGAKTWDRFPSAKRVETCCEDGKGRWRYRIGKEVNEIFGMGKKKYIDLDETHLYSIMNSKVVVDHLVDTLERKDFLSTTRTIIKDALEDLIEVYEKKIDPMLSRLMIAKNQIDKGTHRIESITTEAVPAYLDDVIVSWEDDSDLLRQLIEVVVNTRNKMQGAYKKHRNRANLPAHKPKPGMHDLEKLMGQAKVREEVNEIFGFGRKKKKKARVTLNQLQNIYANYREYMKHYYRYSGRKTIKDLVRDSAKKKRIREIEELIPHIQSDIIVIKKLIEDMASGEYYWPEELQRMDRRLIPNFNDWNLLSDPEKFLDKMLWRMNAAEKNLKNLHRRYAKGLGFDRYTGDVEADYEAIKDFMATAKER